MSNIFKRKEDYKILVADIISNYHIGLEEDFETDNEKIVKSIIEDSFAHNIDVKNNSSVQNIYTKLNKKPNKSTINNISKSIALCYNRLINNLKSSECNIPQRTFISILSYYSDIYYIDDSSKISFLKKKKIEETDSNFEYILKLLNMNSNTIMSILKNNLPEIDLEKT